MRFGAERKRKCAIHAKTTRSFGTGFGAVCVAHWWRAGAKTGGPREKVGILSEFGGRTPWRRVNSHMGVFFNRDHSLSRYDFLSNGTLRPPPPRFNIEGWGSTKGFFICPPTLSGGTGVELRFPQKQGRLAFSAIPNCVQNITFFASPYGHIAKSRQKGGRERASVSV